MKPAFHIPLSATQLRQIGELCAIQAQIEWSMQMVVKKLLGLSLASTLKIMGSTSIRSNSSIWIATIREKLDDQDAVAWAEFAFSQIEKLSEGRNDFIHGLYGLDLSDIVTNSPSNLFMVTSRRKTSDLVRVAGAAGIRLRSHAPTEISRLPKLVNQAARVSVIAAYLDEVAAKGSDRRELLSLRRRLGSRRPPEPPTEVPKKGKGRQPPPRSWRG